MSSNNPKTSSKEHEKVRTLSEKTLANHNRGAEKTHSRYAERLISEERTQMWEQEMFYQRRLIQPAQSSQSVNDGQSFHGIAMYKGGVPSLEESPMERFATLSPANDPHPWMTKSVMKENGINLGAMETAGLRKHAAEVCAGAGSAGSYIEAVDEGYGEGFELPLISQEHERYKQDFRPGLPRVAKPIRLRIRPEQRSKDKKSRS